MFQFFMGLNDSIFGTIRSHIIQDEPLPKIKIVFSRVSKEDQHQNLARAVIMEGQTSAVVVAKSSSTEAMVTTLTSHKSICSHCRKPGHETTNCY